MDVTVPLHLDFSDPRQEAQRSADDQFPEGRDFLQYCNAGPRHFVSNARKIGYENMDNSVRDGGNQIEYEDEDPRIRRIYAEELRRGGIPSKMDALLPA